MAVVSVGEDDNSLGLGTTHRERGGGDATHKQRRRRTMRGMSRLAGVGRGIEGVASRVGRRSSCPGMNGGGSWKRPFVRGAVMGVGHAGRGWGATPL